MSKYINCTWFSKSVLPSLACITHPIMLPKDLRRRHAHLLKRRSERTDRENRGAEESDLRSYSHTPFLNKVLLTPSEKLVNTS